MEFKIGEVVQLRSGGPNMTISDLTYSCEKVICYWFDYNNHLQEGSFNKKTLEYVDDKNQTE